MDAAGRDVDVEAQGLGVVAAQEDAEACSAASLQSVHLRTPCPVPLTTHCRPGRSAAHAAALLSGATTTISRADVVVGVDVDVDVDVAVGSSAVETVGGEGEVEVEVEAKLRRSC